MKHKNVMDLFFNTCIKDIAGLQVLSKTRFTISKISVISVDFAALPNREDN